MKLIKKNKRREQTNRNVIQNVEISEKNQASCWQEQGTTNKISDRLALRKSNSRQFGHQLKLVPSGCSTR